MLLGGDLGRLCSAVAAVVVTWLVVRRKWRRVVARREEIRRRMAFASEEALRFEIEHAADRYSNHASEQLEYEPFIVGPISSTGRQFQCEVCRCPTTTRCKRCKAVHYCSGKCQIIHWRRGHKDECHALTSHGNPDSAVRSHTKEFKQDEIQNSHIEDELRHSTNSVESSLEQRLSSEPSLNVFSGKNDTQVKTNDDGKGTDVNFEALVHSLPGESASATSSSSNFVASNSKLKDCDRHDRHKNLTGSESVKPCRTDCTVDVKGPQMNGVFVDDSLPATSLPEEAVLHEVRQDDLKTRGPLLLSREPSSCVGVSSTSAECCSKIGETKPSSTACHEHKHCMSEEPGPIKDVSGLSSFQLLTPKQLYNEMDRTLGDLDNVKHRKNDSPGVMATEAHLSSSTRTSTHILVDAPSVEIERFHGVATISSENTGSAADARSETSPSTMRVDQFRAPKLVQHSSLGTGSGNKGRYEGSFPYELFVKLYNWKTVELCPRGLINCGNSCYANSVLQCLAFTPPLTAYFLQGLHSRACENKEWCFTCEFESLVKKAKEGASPISPAPIISQVQRIGSHLGNGKEEDAHEFLRYAIDAMQSVCLKEAGVKVPSSFGEETTLVGLMFGGYLRSKIECMKCGGQSEQHERIMDLTVEIGGDIGTLEEALRRFTRSEILEGENKYHCGRCKSYEEAKKKLRVLEAPNVLTIALKRFQSGKFGKLNKAIHFPEILNLARYMSGTSDKSPIYRLYGVVVHIDVMNATFSGHYVCYIKNNQGRWFKADDSSVQEVKLEKVLSDDAYMLLYARCSPRAPRVTRSSMVLHDQKKARNLTRHAAEIWDVCTGKLNGEKSHSDSSYMHCMRGRPPSGATAYMSKDDSSSCYSSLFSDEAEVGSSSSSNSTGSSSSSNRESTSTSDDNFDQILLGDYWSSRPQWRNNSFESAPSSLSSPLSPLSTRHSLSDLDQYSNKAPSCCLNTTEVDRNGFGGSCSSCNKVNVVSRGKRSSFFVS